MVLKFGDAKVRWCLSLVDSCRLAGLGILRIPFALRSPVHGYVIGSELISIVVAAIILFTKVWRNKVW